MNALNTDDYASAPSRWVLPKILGFSVTLALLFTLIANLLPQVEGEAPVEMDVALGDLTMDAFVAMGEEIFTGRGTCLLCHNERGRAPNIPQLNMVATAAERLNDPRYHGKAKTAEEYFRESMHEPSAYVVAGFGKKGSNDTESPMPEVHKPPIGLSAVQIDAVIAFLQVKDGNEVTVSLPTEAPAATNGDAAVAIAPAAARTPQAVFNKYGCQACHFVMGAGGDIGPSLSNVGARRSAEAIRESVIDPNAVVTEGFPSNLMPQDFAERMTAKELEILVRYLADQKG